MHKALREGGRIGAVVYSTLHRNQFFSIPVSIIRTRAQLPPPLPGQPGPFSLGAPGVLEKVLLEAGFRDISVEANEAPVRLPSAAECVRSERESFGALHQMLASAPAEERDGVWQEIEEALRQFERTASSGPARCSWRRQRSRRFRPSPRRAARPRLRTLHRECNGAGGRLRGCFHSACPPNSWLTSPFPIGNREAA